MTSQIIQFDLKLPKDILSINEIFKTNGFKLFVVGGAVRDALLGKDPKDFDLATDALPDMVEIMMKKAGFTTIATGKVFGVINVLTESGEFEIATFRKDIGSGRRPDAVEFTTIEGDVGRRDLTINALFFNIDTKEIIDLVGGIEDLKNKVVRTVGSAEDRFNEDPLRVKRAIRFAGRFESDLDDDIIATLNKGISLDKISAERIRDEFIKGIKSAKNVDFYLDLLNKFKIFKWIFPDIRMESCFFGVLGVNCNDFNNDEILVLATLLRFSDKDLLGKRLNKLTYSKDEIKGIKFLISLLSVTFSNVIEIKRKQKDSGLTPEQIRTFAIKHGVMPFLIDTFLSFELTITGDDVMEEWGLKPGPELGEKILELETKKFVKLFS